MTETRPTRVVFLIVDALPHRLVGSVSTPNIWRLSDDGAQRHRVEAAMSSATYPNHATFATGLEPVDHGVVTNRPWNPESGRHEKMSASRLPVPHLFEVLLAAGRSVTITAGDPSIVRAMGGDALDAPWPPDGWSPKDHPELGVDEYGYVTNDVVAARVREDDALSADLAVIHLNDPDTACHWFGPDSDGAAARIRDADRVVGELVDAVRSSGWDDTVLVIVSDHDQENVDPDRGVDIDGALRAIGVVTHVEYEGTAALLGTPVAPLDVDAETVASLAGVDGATALPDGRILCWTTAGHIFSPSDDHGLRGAHGSPRTCDQLAVVTGGHPAAADLSAALAAGAPRAADWAPTLAALLGVEFRPVSTHARAGRDLLSTTV